MLTLTNAANITRRVIVFLLFTFVLGFFLLIIYSTVKNTISNLKPSPPSLILTTFGQIPKSTFPQQNFPQDIKFYIETISGSIPQASSTAKIYFLPKKQQGLLTNIRADQDAKKIGFYQQGKTVDQKLIFNENGREFTIDPITRNFTYSYDYINDGSVFSGKNTLTKASVTNITSNFLNLLSAIPTDYDLQNPQVTFLTFNGAEFVPLAQNEEIGNATAARIDYFRKKIDNLPVVTPKYNEGNIYVIVSKSEDKNKQIIKAEKQYQEISFENTGIYPLKDSSLAWEDFLKGKGFIASSGNSTFTKKVIIRDAYLAYYDNPENQSYLMPIYVFTGDNDFIGYTDAVSPEWLTQ